MTRGIIQELSKAFDVEDQVRMRIIGSLNNLQNLLLLRLIKEVRDVRQDTSAILENVNERLGPVFEELLRKLALPSASTILEHKFSFPTDDEYRVERPELGELERRLPREGAVGIGGVTSVGGAGGVGKSLLAIRYARLHYGDRALYVSMDSGSLESIIAGLGQDLGARLPADQGSAGLPHTLQVALANHDGLLIVDNAEDAASVQMVLPPRDGQCRAIVI